MKKLFLGINITVEPYNRVVNSLINQAQQGVSSYTCVANVHMLIEANDDVKFQNIVNNSTICTPDGMPLVWGLRFLYNLKQERVAGMDLLPDLLKQAENKDISVYFYGGSQQMLDLTKKYLHINYPLLKIAGLYSPPFRQLSIEEEIVDISRISASNAGIIFVALGCPKQEKWMAKNKDKLKIPMIGIGGALPVLIGMQSRAPLWIQKSSLEWLFRLIQEPKRLFRRYAVTNTKFLILLFTAKYRQLFSNNRYSQ